MGRGGGGEENRHHHTHTHTTQPRERGRRERREMQMQNAQVRWGQEVQRQGRWQAGKGREVAAGKARAGVGNHLLTQSCPPVILSPPSSRPSRPSSSSPDREVVLSVCSSSTVLLTPGSVQGVCVEAAAARKQEQPRTGGGVCSSQPPGKASAWGCTLLGSLKAKLGPHPKEGKGREAAGRKKGVREIMESPLTTHCHTTPLTTARGLLFTHHARHMPAATGGEGRLGLNRETLSFLFRGKEGREGPEALPAFPSLREVRFLKAGVRVDAQTAHPPPPPPFSHTATCM